MSTSFTYEVVGRVPDTLMDSVVRISRAVRFTVMTDSFKEEIFEEVSGVNNTEKKDRRKIDG